MMGRKEESFKLIYLFRLEERVPDNHFLRLVKEIIDFDFIYELTKPFYSHTGTPSVYPVVVFKMALLGYFYGINSERQLAERCRMDLSFMWFLGYDLDETTPDHSILSKARARFGINVYQHFFNHVVRICQEAGFIQGDKLYFKECESKKPKTNDRWISRTNPDAELVKRKGMVGVFF